MRRAVMISTLAMVVGCGDEPIQPAMSTGVILVRNLRGDTVGGLQRTVCSGGAAVIRDLPAGTFVVPNGTIATTVQPGCYVLHVFNVRDSLIDSRPSLDVEAADTIIVRLVE